MYGNEMIPDHLFSTLVVMQEKPPPALLARLGSDVLDMFFAIIHLIVTLFAIMGLLLLSWVAVARYGRALGLATKLNVVYTSPPPQAAPTTSMPTSGVGIAPYEYSKVCATALVHVVIWVLLKICHHLTQIDMCLLDVPWLCA